MKLNIVLVRLSIICGLLLIPLVGVAQLWTDDFEDNNIGGPAEGWVSTGDGDWKVVLDESKTYDQSITSARDTWSIAYSCPELANYLFKLKVKVTGVTDTASVQVLARVSGRDYHLGCVSTPEWTGLFIYDDFEGILLDTLSYPLELDTWYYYLTYLNGDVIRLKVWETGEPEPQEYMLEGVGTNWMPGRIGLRTTGAAARFDDVEISETTAQMTCECLTPVFCRGKNFYFKVNVTNNSQDPISGTIAFTAYSGYRCDPLSVLVVIPRLKTYPPGLTESSYFFKAPGGAAPGPYSVSVNGSLEGDALFCCMDADIIQCQAWKAGVNKEWELGEVDHSGEAQPLPLNSSLSQNYPNPFNVSTTMSYQLAVEAYVKLGVYDLVGRTVATLVSERQEPGYKSVCWDASQIPSGIYFYRLRAGDFIDTKRMLLVK